MPQRNGISSCACHNRLRGFNESLVACTIATSEPVQTIGGIQDRGAALRDYWTSQGVTAAVHEEKDMYRSVWPVAGTPLVTVVIPNRNAAAVLEPCLSGLLDRTAYRQVEVVIVDNGSTEPAVLDLYRTLEESGRGRIIPFDRPSTFRRPVTRAPSKHEASCSSFSTMMLKSSSRTGWRS